ncbi:MetQ/NlpA family ABC transporter substrate-binding protein [Zafaria sp. Z1313]|uniref:MetQ/NlpA family ABC transporter substrate-binding protein n=1 Tax=unclassified Zafaria TaxID=2828765 RepID=UPI002E793D23|nr:MetQ/NlpA family ABC transporter substrate-binding protein [Zafaria sp. J156]MEE1620358.1 MetQ/NlpA family ABC transporter substrate-binding protein [Zafaria sp. J156]
MRQKIALAVTGAAALFALTACGGGDTGAADTSADTNSAGLAIVKVGASPVPHARILEFIDENLAADAGIDLDITEIDDYQTPNTALSEGTLDANFYQHLPWFEDQVATKGYDFEHGEGVHIEPFAAFSDKYSSAGEIPDGAKVVVTNDPANQLRALRVLEQAGLLSDISDDSSVLTLSDEQNPKKLAFSEVPPEQAVQVFKQDSSFDIGMINGNFILQAGLKSSDALAVEETEGNPYANFLAWRAGEQSDAIATLDELLHSDEVAAFIEETWPDGDVIPAF